MDSSPYDCIVDVNQELLKVQIKSTTKTPNEGEPNVQVTLINGVKINYTLGNVDYFVVWSQFYDGFFIFPNTGNMQAVRISLTGERKHQFNNFDFNKESRYNQLELSL